MLKNQDHKGRVVHTRIIFLNIDLAQRGLGGDTSWGTSPHHPYPGRTYSYSFILSIDKW
ncbi:hypothetical protein ED352_04205 [Muribaculaceae bacterium Isolate-002 (NCI)]|nr:hypothetical protein ED352_04205 [Muribaculaceae bacterium Isolate-002 (NCI)]